MRTLNRLNKTKIASAKPGENTRTLTDGGGLVLQVHPSGAKWWRLRYRYGGNEKMLSMGVYPDTTLKAAREKRDAARKLLASDPPIDPSEVRRAEKAAQADSFKSVSEQWFTDKQSKKAENTLKRNRRVLKMLNERIGTQSVSKVTTTTAQRALRSIQKKHGVEAAHRAHGLASRIFSYAIASGQASSDPTAGLKDSLKEQNVTHRAAIIDPARVGQLMRAIDAYTGNAATRAGLQLLALNFTRPSELRLGRWDEIDFDKELWVIPASRMKMRAKNPSDHLLPLSSQSVAILKGLQKITGHGQYVFCAVGNQPLSENTLNKALRMMGFSDHTGHSFRSTASTMLHELNFPPEVIETQLAHKRPGVSAIYNRAHLLPQRRAMLQYWADYLDQLRKKSSNVVPIKAQGAA